MADCIGTIKANIIDILGLPINVRNIYLGESNISHMENELRNGQPLPLERG